MKSNIQTLSYSDLLREFASILAGSSVISDIANLSDPKLGEQVVGTLNSTRTRSLCIFGAHLDREIARLKAESLFGGPVRTGKRRSKKKPTDKESCLRLVQLSFLDSAIHSIIKSELFQEHPMLVDPTIEIGICSNWQIVAIRRR